MESPVTVPKPLMERLVAPLTVQTSVLDWPAVTLAGLALKELIMGAAGDGLGLGGVPLAIKATLSNQNWSPA